jgi:hypothetical protein
MVDVNKKQRARESEGEQKEEAAEVPEQEHR